MENPPSKTSLRKRAININLKHKQHETNMKQTTRNKQTTNA